MTLLLQSSLCGTHSRMLELVWHCNTLLSHVGMPKIICRKTIYNAYNCDMCSTYIDDSNMKACFPFLTAFLFVRVVWTVKPSIAHSGQVNHHRGVVA